MRLLVLVPAHDEELLLGACLASLRAMRTTRSCIDVVVLADACTDGTTMLAREAGVRVLEHGAARPLGKGPLLRWALDRLDLSATDVVVVLDADSVADAGLADAIADAGSLRDAAAQTYLGLSNPGDTWLTQLGLLLNAVRYDGQFPLRNRAGLNVPLNGNGMCFGVDLLADEGLPIETLKEDLELYARFTARGRRVAYVRHARVLTQEPRTLGQASVQRSRWQAGKLAILRRLAPRLLVAPIPLAQRLDSLAELLPVGPVGHAATAVGLATFCLALPGAGARVLAGLFLASLMPMTAWTIAVLAHHPQRGALARALVALPVYAFWRVGLLVLGAVGGGPSTWRRTPRHDAG